MKHKLLTGFPGGSVAPAMQEIQVQSLEKEKATHSSILARGIPWTEEPVGLQTMGSESDMT